MTVHGYSVFPQLDINIPRDSLHINPLISYPAIATLTDDFLRLLPKLNFSYKEDIWIRDAEKLDKNDWEILSQNVSCF